MTKEKFIEVVEWQKNTFPHATALSKIAHLAEELEEVVADLKSNSAKTNEEFADCFLLLFGAAAAYGMTYKDICDSIDIKMLINKARKWGNPDAQGVVKHIEQ